MDQTEFIEAIGQHLPMPDATPARPWWRDAVIYEINVRSFADADGDGLGDLTGIRSRLPESNISRGIGLQG